MPPPPMPSSSSSTPSRHDRAHPVHRVRSSATPTRVSSPLANGSRRTSGSLGYGEQHAHTHNRSGQTSPYSSQYYHPLPDRPGIHEPRARAASSSLRRTRVAEEEDQHYGYGHLVPEHLPPPAKAQRLGDDLDGGSLETPSPNDQSTRESSEARARYAAPQGVVEAFKEIGHRDKILAQVRELFTGPGPGAPRGHGNGNTKTNAGVLREPLWRAVEALVASHAKACPAAAVDLASDGDKRLQWIKLCKLLKLEKPARAPIDDGKGGTYVPMSFPEVVDALVKHVFAAELPSKGDSGAPASSEEDEDGAQTAATLWGLDRSKLPDIRTLSHEFTRDFVEKNGLLYADCAPPDSSTPASSAPQHEGRRDEFSGATPGEKVGHADADAEGQAQVGKEVSQNRSRSRGSDLSAGQGLPENSSPAGAEDDKKRSKEEGQGAVEAAGEGPPEVKVEAPTE